MIYKTIEKNIIDMLIINRRLYNEKGCQAKSDTKISIWR